MNGVEPYAYLRDVLQRMVDGHLINRIGELLPWTWKAGDSRQILTACAVPTLFGFWGSAAASTPYCALLPQISVHRQR
jgi:hypothetical protein